MAEQKGTEVNKNSTSYTSVVEKKKEKKNKERVWGQTNIRPTFAVAVLVPKNSEFFY